MGDDWVTCLLDEICLEGLDGITLEDLWARLNERPGFDLTLDDASKEFLWTIIKKLDDIEFHELREERHPLVIFNRYKYLDPELGTVLEPDEVPEDIYPFHPIDDVNNGVMGSCFTYYTRGKIKDDLQPISYSDIISKYGRKLVMVGSQGARQAALMGDETDPSVELTVMHYCILERIGRSRYHGEITQGKISLQAVGEDPKSLFYHRKFLTSNNYISKQVHHLKTGSQNCSGSLLHLPRFYIERKPRALYLTERVIEILKMRPNCLAQYDEIREELGLSNSLKKLFKTFDFQRFVKTDLRIPYRVIHPDAKMSEWKLKANDREKTIRVIQLIDPNMNAQDIWARDDEFEEPEEDTEPPESFEQVIDRPLLSQAYYVLEEAGAKGLSQLELGSRMGISKLQSRTVCRNLLKTGLASVYMNDIGRQRVARFMAKIYENECEMTQQFNREKEKMLALTYENEINDTNPNKETNENNKLTKPAKPRKRKSKAGRNVSTFKKRKTVNAGHGAKNDIIIISDMSETNSVDVSKGETALDSRAVTEWFDTHQLIKRESSQLLGTSHSVPVQSSANQSNVSQVIQDVSCQSGDTSTNVEDLSSKSLYLSLSLKDDQVSMPPKEDVTSLHKTPERSKIKLTEGENKTDPSSDSTKMEADRDETILPLSGSVPLLTSTPQQSSSEQSVVRMESVSEGGIVTEIIQSSAVKKPSGGFADDLKNYFANQLKDSYSITYRLLKRANMIMDCVRTHKVVEDFTKLLKMIAEEEDKEGYNVRIDKKSLLRLLSKLSNDGYLKVIKVILKAGGKQKVLHFICEPAITVDHSVIQSAIEQARVKFLVPPKEKIPKSTKVESVPDITDDINRECPTVCESVTEFNNVNICERDQPLVYDKRIGKKYGFSPKFVRMRTLHQFLFYVIAGYEGKCDLDQEKVIDNLKDQGIVMSEEEFSNMGRIFHPEISWKMFISPLPEHNGWPKGWALMCDILLRLPLSIFVKVINTSYIVPDIESYLNHPVRQHFLVKNLPANMRYCLIAKRKYIFSVHEVMQRLCFIGLVRFGPQRLKEKDQVFLYMNRRTHLLDTTTSKPGYHQVTDNIIYEERKYYFRTMADVEKYWYDMWNICLHTNLGGRLCVMGKDIVLEMLNNKPAMVKALEPVTPEDVEATDVGEVPGDKKGAGGLDSALFSHLKRNWNWSCNIRRELNESAYVPQKPVLKLQKPPSVATGIKKNKGVFDSYVGNIKKHKHLQPPATRKPLVSSSGIHNMNTLPPFLSSSKRRKITRRVQMHKKSRRHRPAYDEIDQAALLLMNKLRVDWSHAEDNLLLLCKVAMTYLCPIVRQQLVNFQTLRDVLHKKLPESHNKTTKACQRRITYVMKNQSTANSVALFLEELRQDSNIKEKFEISIPELRKKYETPEEVEKIVADKFVELVDVLEKRFDLLGSAEASRIIPNNPELFWKKYGVICPSKSLKKKGSFQDVKTIVDIQKAVIHTIINSSLSNLQDKTSWSYQLFKVYQQFPENLLRSTMNKLRQDQMVSLKKNYVYLSHKRRNLLPLSCSPFQLSITFRHLLQTNYQYSLFHQTFEMLNNLKNWELANKNRILNDKGMKLMITNGGSTAAVAELFCKGEIEFNVEIPEQIITLNPKVSEVDESYARIIERYRELLRSYKPGDETVSSSSVFKKRCTSKDENNSDIDSDEEENKDDPLYTPCDDPGSSSSSFARTASRIALYMMREELEDKMIDNNQHAHDFFVVNSCTVYCTVTGSSSENRTRHFEEKIEKMFPLTTEEIQSVIEGVKSKICVVEDRISEEDLKVLFINSGWTESDWPNMLKIVNYLAEKKEFGAKLRQLKVACQKYFKGSQFSEVASFLLKNNIVIRSGVTGVRYIHRKFANIWLVSSRRLSRYSREKIKPTSCDALHMAGGYKRDVIIRNERRRTVKRKRKQKTDLLKKRKLGCEAVAGKMKNKRVAIQSLHCKEKLSAFKTKRQKLLLQSKRQCHTEIKKKKLLESSGRKLTERIVKDSVAAEDILGGKSAVTNHVDGNMLFNYQDCIDQKGASIETHSLNEVSDSNMEVTSEHEKITVSIQSTDEILHIKECDTQGIANRRKHDEKLLLSPYSKGGISVSVADTEPEGTGKCSLLGNSKESLAHIDNENIDNVNIDKSRNKNLNIDSKNGQSICEISETDLKVIPEDEFRIQACTSECNILTINSEGTSTDEAGENNKIKSKQDKINDSDTTDGGLKLEKSRIQIRRKRRVGEMTQQERRDIHKAVQTRKLEDAAKQLENSEPIQISLRPWIRINGTLSRRIFDRLLGAVLGHCMIKPGNTLQSIGERFSPALLPFHVRELVETLTTIGCVKLYILRKSCTATLFSPPSKVTLEPADGTESASRIIVDPQPDAISRLGQFIGNKAYKKDFLSC